MKTSLALVGAVLLLSPGAPLVTLGDPAPTPRYQAHEWGTFTSVQGTDGTPLAWNPFTQADLPAFVYERRRPLPEAILAKNREGFAMFTTKDSQAWRQRMETPVIYFHTDEPLTLRARVGFPQGLLTEWFPRATAFGPVFGVDDVLPETRESFLEWPAFQVSPAETPPVTPLPHESGPSHYYAARQARSGVVTVPGLAGGPAETDRFLFYRGAGNFSTPLRLSMPSPRQLIVVNTGRQPLLGLYVVESRGDRVYHVGLPELGPGKSQTIVLPELTAFAPREAATVALTARLERDLTATGLHADEAAAMVSTWRDAWFGDDGLRVLYQLPREWTDATLPLQLTPAPQELVRVMVGRAEIFTPNEERMARAAFSQFQTHRDDRALAAGFAPVNPRFREPLLTRVGQIETAWAENVALFSCALMPDPARARELMQEDLKAARRALQKRDGEATQVDSRRPSDAGLSFNTAPVLFPSDRVRLEVQSAPSPGSQFE